MRRQDFIIKSSTLKSRRQPTLSKIASTYMLESKWQMAIKQIEHAIRINKHINEYYIMMGNVICI